MTIARFTPINDVVSLREAMDRLFEDSFIRPNGSWSGLPAGQVAVPVDLWETKDAYHLRADLPGLTPEDIEISTTADTFEFSGALKSSADVPNEDWLRQERPSGKFPRSFTVPMQIYPIGTLAEIVRPLRIPDGRAQIIVQGLPRVHIKDYLPEQRYLRVTFDVLTEDAGNAVEREALLRSVRALFEKYVDNGGSIL